MRFGLNKQPPEPRPRPQISEPVPGSGRRFAPNPDGSVPPNPLPGGATGRPHNEYPHNQPVPNPLLMQRGDGSYRLERMPQGATLDQPMPSARPQDDTVPIAQLGWPQNNHTTNTLNRLRGEHRQALQNLEEARMGLPYISDAEKSTLTKSGLKERKKEVAEGKKAAKPAIHGLEKAERHARRAVDVYRSRYSKELRTEADFREKRASSSRESLGDAEALAPHASLLETPAVPRRPGPSVAPFGRSSRPDLPTIPEREPSPPTMPPNGERAASRMESRDDSGPATRRLNELKDEYRSAKNAYYGMKPESAKHDPADVRAARDRYKRAEADLDSFRSENRFSLHLESQGHVLPSTDELRQMLHPRTNDNYPRFPGPGEDGPSAV